MIEEVKKLNTFSLNHQLKSQVLFTKRQNYETPQHVDNVCDQ